MNRYDDNDNFSKKKLFFVFSQGRCYDEKITVKFFNKVWNNSVPFTCLFIPDYRMYKLLPDYIRNMTQVDEWKEQYDEEPDQVPNLVDYMNGINIKLFNEYIEYKKSVPKMLTLEEWKEGRMMF